MTINLPVRDCSPAPTVDKNEPMITTKGWGHARSATAKPPPTLSPNLLKTMNDLSLNNIKKRLLIKVVCIIKTLDSISQKTVDITDKYTIRYLILFNLKWGKKLNWNVLNIHER